MLRAPLTHVLSRSPLAAKDQEDREAQRAKESLGTYMRARRRRRRRRRPFGAACVYKRGPGCWHFSRKHMHTRVRGHCQAALYPAARAGKNLLTCACVPRMVGDADCLAACAAWREREPLCRAAINACSARAGQWELCVSANVCVRGCARVLFTGRMNDFCVQLAFLEASFHCAVGDGNCTKILSDRFVRFL